MIGTVLAFLPCSSLPNVPVCSYIVKPANTVLYLFSTLTFYYLNGTYGEHQLLRTLLRLLQFTLLRLHVCSFIPEQK